MLVLVPSRFELGLLAPGVRCEDGEVVTWADGGIEIALCGVGLAEAGACAGYLLARRKGERVVLAGICGTLHPEALPVGAAFVASSIACDGIGVGSGEHFRPFSSATGPMAAETLARAGSIAGEEDLHSPLVSPSIPGLSSGGLLSVAGASADEQEAARRRALHPGCLAEDMEAMAVSHAARLAGCSLLVVKGVSNVAGERRHAEWRTAEALRGVALALRWLVAEARA